jgi:hypothetical protein
MGDGRVWNTMEVGCVALIKVPLPTPKSPTTVQNLAFYFLLLQEQRIHEN